LIIAGEMETVIVLLGVIAFAYGQITTPSPEDAKCLEDAFQVHYRAMVQYPETAEYGASAFGPRLFYTAMWNKPITSLQLQKFCDGYLKGIKAYDNCAHSTSKQTRLAPFLLPDYICRRRADDYIANLPCLQKNYKEAVATCKSDCAQWEEGSRYFVEPPANRSMSENRKSDQRADCLYLNCSAHCHVPIFEKQCNASAANLEVNALYVMTAAFLDMSILPEYRAQLSTLMVAGRVDLMPFPEECFQLAGAAATVLTT